MGWDGMGWDRGRWAGKGRGGREEKEGLNVDCIDSLFERLIEQLKDN